MKEVRAINVAICEGCGREKIGVNDHDAVPGFYGHVEHVTVDSILNDLYPDRADFYACKTRCIASAAQKALAALEQAPAGEEVVTHGSAADAVRMASGG